MPAGIFQVFTKTMAAAGTTAAFDVDGAFDKMYLQIPTMPSAANLSIDVSADAGSSYYQLRHWPPNSTATVAAPTFIIAATAAANGAAVPIPGGFHHFRVVADSAPATAQAFKVVCAN